MIIILCQFKYKLINLGITLIQTLSNEMGEKNVGNTVQITLGKSQILYTNISRFVG